MAASDPINPSGLIDDAKCFTLVCQHCSPEGARWPWCGSGAAIRDGCDDTRSCRQWYRYKACAERLDDLTGTVLAGHHQPLRVLCLPFVYPCLSHRQIVGELGLAVLDVQAMVEQLHRDLVTRMLAVKLQGEVEPDARASSGIDEVCIVAGHKGQPAAVAKKTARALSQAGKSAGPRVGLRRASRPSPA